MITAQDLYDRREEYGEISGIELHQLFRDLVGEPSPAGRMPITLVSLAEYDAGGNMAGFVNGIMTGAGCYYCATGQAHDCGQGVTTPAAACTPRSGR